MVDDLCVGNVASSSCTLGGYLVPMSYGLTPRGRMLKQVEATVISQQGFSLVLCNGLLPLQESKHPFFLTLDHF